MANTIPQARSRMTDTNARPEQNVRVNSKETILRYVVAPGGVPRHSIRPYYLPWPVSKPGSLAKQPPSGQWPINLLRREQLVEVGYGQVTTEQS